MKKSTTKKLFASLPMIWLILGAVAIATELHKPMAIDQQISATVAPCPISTSVTGRAGLYVGASSFSSHQDDPVICSK